MHVRNRQSINPSVCHVLMFRLECHKLRICLVHWDEYYKSPYHKRNEHLQSAQVHACFSSANQTSLSQIQRYCSFRSCFRIIKLELKLEGSY